MTEHKATWSISLDTTCPKCGECVDLLDDPDFWDGRSFEAGENMTDRSRDVEVDCPKCGHELEVDLEY